MSTVASSIKRGVAAAARLHQRLMTRPLQLGRVCPIDVFAVLQNLGVPVMIRPLEGLLGAFIKEPAPGVLITSLRPFSVQRFTAAHELGHFVLGHAFSADDEGVLRRSPFSSTQMELQEIEANAFAASFLMPRWLMMRVTEANGWNAASLTEPLNVYQLSLRLGASFSATVYTLQRYRLINPVTAKALSEAPVKKLKKALLGEVLPENYRGDVWLLTEADRGAVIAGSRNDHFIVSVNEHSSSGYLWDFAELKKSGFVVLQDGYEDQDDGLIGSINRRSVTLKLGEPSRGLLLLKEARPWDHDDPLSTLNLEYELTGPEQTGLSRVAKQRLLADQ